MTTAVTTLDDVQHAAAAVAAGLDQLSNAEYWKFPGDDLLAAARAVERLARRIYAVQVAVVGEIDLARLAQTHGQTSTAVLLRNALSIGPGDAAIRVRTARQILPQNAISGGEIPPQLPELGHYLHTGNLGAEQSAIIVKTMSKIPTEVPADIRKDAEHTLIVHARTMDPVDLNKVAARLLLTLDPNGDFEPTDPADRTELALGTRDVRTGLTPIKGNLDDSTVAAFIAATDPHAQPRPETDGVKDHRCAATRLAHALSTVLDAYLTIGDGPVQGGERPHVTMTVQYDALTSRLGDATLTAAGTPAGPALARRILCDCDVIPTVLGSAGEPLDIGRATRIWPTAIRRAAILRDGGCLFPGCDRPARWTEIHHVAFWVNGGPTSLDNAACLCGVHHALVHKGDWQVRMAKDGRPGNHSTHLGRS